MTALLLSACVSEKSTEFTRSGLRPADFEAVIDSVDNHLYVLTTGDIEACITNYGARLVSLMVPDRDGRSEDVVQGFPTISGYTENNQNFGATVGRYIGRILGAEYTLDGQTVSLQKGGNGHCGHGGSPNFGARMWRTVAYDGRSLTLSYTSPDGENGFPGRLVVLLTYSLTDDGRLDLSYEATTDKPTVINLTNHSFFNISGDLARPVVDQVMYIKADSITAYDEQKCVTGEYLSVSGSPFDFRTPQAIGNHIDDDNAQLNVTKGYDHCWTTGFACSAEEPVAWVYDEASGRRMEVYTTEPGLHVYTANGLKGALVGKDSIAYPRRSSVCFETCHFQNSPNYPQFPTTVLRPGETFRSHTTYRFVTE